ncbi:hypothetical protein AA0521_0302 [Komagataeibacter intermedius NRIC 0521]|uniref:Uncharacterized protein n=1 Tax=Komagataeibacter intermedius NRIC 0521 TaxID=1307934 RepID=A0ABQ0PHD8_9PROT|nr:hypothetical protein AA0521_0302 [Komagataeibacter intermedius NRIC 0521]
MTCPATGTDMSSERATPGSIAINANSPVPMAKVATASAHPAAPRRAGMAGREDEISGVLTCLPFSDRKYWLTP